MNKETLQAVANEAKRFTDLYRQDKERGIGLSYSEWLNYTENSTRNRINYARTEAVLGIYRSEDAEVAEDTSPSISILGQEEFPSVFPKLGQLQSVIDEKTALLAELSKLNDKMDKASKGKAKKGSKLDTIPEENEEEEKTESKENVKEAKKLSPDEQRKQEINTRLKDLNKEQKQLGIEMDKYNKEKAEYDKKVIEENRKKASEDKAEYQNDLETNERNGLISRIGLLSAAKAHLNNRTWKDYLFHPFRSIGENMRYSEMRESFLAEYGMDEKQLDSIVSTVGNGDEKALNGIDSIDRNGEIKKEEKDNSVVQKKEDISVEPKEKEELRIQLDESFAPNKAPLVEEKQPTVDAPKLDNPNLHQ